MAWATLGLIRPFRSQPSLRVALSPSFIPPAVPSHVRGLKPGTSEWILQCRRNHIPALNGTSCRSQRPLLARGEDSEELETRDQERNVTKLKDDVATVSIARATVESDVADLAKEESEVGGIERGVRKLRRGTRKVQVDLAKVKDDVAVSESDAADVTEILLSLGCTWQQLQRILNKKNLVFIVKHRQHILRKAALFSRYGIDSQQFLDIVEKDVNRNPRFLSGQDEKHESVLNYLQGTLKVNNLGKMIRGYLPVLNFLPSTLESKLLFTASLGVPISACMLEKYANILGFSEKTIKKGVEEVKAIFSDTLGVTILLRFPMLACRDPRALQERVKAIQELFGDDMAKRLLMRKPTILMATSSTMRRTYKQLQQCFGDEKCLKAVQIEPTLLGNSWDTMSPKLDFLVKEMGRTIEDVAADPRVLSFSLERRLKPRYDSLTKAKIESGDYSLQTIFGPTNKKFEDRFGVSLPRRE